MHKTVTLMCCSFQMLMRKNTTTVLNRLFLLRGLRSNTLITTVLPFLPSVTSLQLWLPLSAMEVGALCVTWWWWWWYVSTFCNCSNALNRSLSSPFFNPTTHYICVIRSNCSFYMGPKWNRTLMLLLHIVSVWEHVLRVSFLPRMPSRR